MADFSMFVPNVHFEQIPIKNLVSNQEYQRNISEQHVLNAAAHFDLYQINPVKVRSIAVASRIAMTSSSELSYSITNLSA